MFTKMSGNPESQKKLENFKMDNPVELARAFKDKQIEGFKDLKILETDVDINNTVADIDNTAKEAIKLLDKEKLISFIEQSLKVEGESGKEWLTYSGMRQNPFFPFMVQSSIDLLSDELMNDDIEIKYDENGNEDEKGKTLDEYIGLYGGIDNIYGSGTWKTVKMVQNILGLEPADGFAGPQFFEKVCSFLKGEDVDVSNFKVHGYDEENKYPYGFEKTVTNDPEGRTKTEEMVDDNYTKYTITDLGNLVNKEKFPENSCVVYENNDVNYIFYKNGTVKDVKDVNNIKTGNWSINGGNIGVTREGSTESVIIYEKAAKDDKIIENEVVEENKDDGKYENIWNGLYKVKLPDLDGLSLEENGENSYKIKYKTIILGEIILQSNMLARLDISKNGNIEGNIDNKDRTNSGIIELKLLEKKEVGYYGKNFVLDYGLGASGNENNRHLEFLDESGTYNNMYIDMETNGTITCEGKEGKLYAFKENSADSGKDIEITQDPNDLNKYYANRKEDTEG